LLDDDDFQQDCCGLTEEKKNISPDPSNQQLDDGVEAEDLVEVQG